MKFPEKPLIAPIASVATAVITAAVTSVYAGITLLMKRFATMLGEGSCTVVSAGRGGCNLEKPKFSFLTQVVSPSIWAALAVLLIVGVVVMIVDIHQKSHQPA